MINIIAPINQLGYGVAGLNIVKALSRISPVALWTIGQPQITNQEDADICKQAIEMSSVYDPSKPCLRIWHQHDLSQFIGRGKHVGFPIFELDTFNKIELHHLRSVDELFVCSNWAKNVIKENKIDVPVQVIPLGVDASIFKPVEPTQQEKTIFFNCGKWEVRKGHDILIKAFKQAFDATDNVELWMMCQNPFNSPQEENEWESLYNDPKIKIIPRVETQEQVYNIMQKVDCGVFPSRGEGWNLEALELLSCGKHIIVTDYSAHTEFCTKDNANLVTIKEKELAFDNKWFHGQGSWAKIGEPQIEQTANYMKDFHINNKRSEINQRGIETALEFSWDNTARKILENV